jgi:L-threonine-O-3-phosphate decarboxylase
MANVVHGGVTEAELADARMRGRELVDLSASLNPYGPHPRVVEAARAATLARYPEADSHTLRACYAAAAGVEPGNVLAGNGSTELLYLLARAVAAPGTSALIFGPTFGEYRAAAGPAGMQTIELRADPPGFVLDLGRCFECIASAEPRLVFLCNPNNPTGTILQRDQLGQMLQVVRQHGGTLVVDEAYMDFAWPANESVLPAPGLAVVRSLTKIHAIPGLRLGFLLAEPDMIAAVERQQPSWNVSAPAAAAGMEAIRQSAFASESRERVATTRDRLKAALGASGLVLGPSLANFLLIEAGDAARARAALLERGWVVRDCTSFGLPGHIRASIPRDELADRLANDLVECLR